MIVKIHDTNLLVNFSYVREEKGRFAGRPRTTVCTIRDMNGRELSVGIATCNMKADRCRKKEGRHIALNRAMLNYLVPEARPFVELAQEISDRVEEAMSQGLRRA